MPELPAEATRLMKPFEVGLKVAQGRHRAKLSQADFARKLGVSRKTISESLFVGSADIADLDNLPYSAGYLPWARITLPMKQIKETDATLRGLGERLRTARLARNDTMAIFAERLGVSERTVRAMEHGSPTVQVGAWLNALWILDALEPLDGVLAPRESLLDRARNSERPRRKRASRRRS